MLFALLILFFFLFKSVSHSTPRGSMLTRVSIKEEGWGEWERLGENKEGVSWGVRSIVLSFIVIEKTMREEGD